MKSGGSSLIPSISFMGKKEEVNYYKILHL